MLLVIGGWAVHHTLTAADLCAAAPEAQGCSRTLSEQEAGIVALLVGVLLTLLGGGFLLRRARVAVRCGAPWVIHRQLTGRWSSFTVGRAVIAGVVVTLVASALVHHAWSTRAHQQRAVAYQRAQQALPDVLFPASLHAVTSGGPGCQTSSTQRCATSPLTPTQLEPALAQLVRGHQVGATINAAIGCVDAQCPVEVLGTLRGSPVLIFAFRHLLDSRKEAVPPGAVPIKAGKSVFFWSGSDVMIGLVGPHGQS
jgi:hypothetical protein